MIKEKAYYLWGLFPPEETEYLYSIKNKVQIKLLSPNFEPHITLAGPYFNIDNTFICKLRTFVESNSSIMLQVDGYCFKQEMFKSFYIAIKNSINLKKLRKNISNLNICNLDTNYSPHISLCYGNHEIQEKEELISKLPKLYELIRISKIALVEINEDIDQWKIKQSFYLN
tara:strand:- start:74 stop:586 length:513 start_codon:yes stop_codon:yes gene_type:complete